MLGHRELGMDDYVDILRRRRWLILIPTLVMPVLAYAGSLALPNRYTSKTLVVVEEQKVPVGYVKPVVSDDLMERLMSMQQQILSRTRLQPVIERFGLYKEELKTVPMEDVLERMRRAITIVPATSPTAQKTSPPAFTITFTGENPRTAQEVCSAITTMFVEENLRIRGERAQGTTAFLQKQLDDAQRKLDEQDAKLADFKRRYLGQLPGQEQANLNILMGLTTQLEAVTQLLNRTQQDKAYAESILSQQLSSWQASQAGNNPQTLDQQLAALQNQLITLEGRYTSDHPDVIKLKNEIAQLKKKIDEATTAAKDKSADKTESAALTEPPQIQQLRSQIHQYEQTMKEKTREQERLQGQIGIYQSRVQLSPLVEQQFKELTRDTLTAQRFYDDLLTKRTTSEISADMERRQQGEQFRVMDPANLPAAPSFPDRRLFAAGGLGGGLALGLGLALLLEMRDKAIRSERDIEFYLQLPTLTLVPLIGEENSDQKNSFRKKGRAKGTRPGQGVEV